LRKWIERADDSLTDHDCSPASGPLGRSPYGGRNWEGFSPDPYLSGVGMEQSVRGLQDAGVQATAKHYMLNEQETLRAGSAYGNQFHEGVSSNVDGRTVRELFVPLGHSAGLILTLQTSFTCGHLPTQSRLTSPLSCATTIASTDHTDARIPR
jgi:hypothetical protein